MCSAEVADSEQMQAALGSATERFGPIDGVIHAAGVPGDGAIQLKSREEAMAVLRGKVHGTRVLAEVLSKQHPDFLVLCSSVNAVVGGFGQVDYCAANAFLDAFAHAHKARTGMTTISVNWDMWSDVGMALNTNVPERLREQRSIDLKLGITAARGAGRFRTAAEMRFAAGSRVHPRVRGNAVEPAEPERRSLMQPPRRRRKFV